MDERGFLGGTVIKNPSAMQEVQEMWVRWVGKISWSRKWQPAPVFLPGKLHDRARRVIAHGVPKSWTQLRDSTAAYE